MEFVSSLFDFAMHIDVHLEDIINQYGALTYLILFLIIFCETGFVVTPFLPGDSMLFAAGALASKGAMNVITVFFVLSLAAILGDTVNYYIGKKIGSRIVTKETNRFIKKEYIDRTYSFYQKHGGKTIVLARFIPIIRTFAPFVAGIGEMKYVKFIGYNIAGALLWSSLFLFGGYFFGSIPVIKNNFTFVIMAIVVISTLPPFLMFIKQKINSKKTAQ